MVDLLWFRNNFIQCYDFKYTFEIKKFSELSINMPQSSIQGVIPLPFITFPFNMDNLSERIGRSLNSVLSSTDLILDALSISSSCARTRSEGRYERLSCHTRAKLG